MTKVTVLVAVYNTEQYLPRCLDSLLSQTLHDIQVVCIDDASTDGSLSILRHYSDSDPRIEVIVLSENHGQAYARNQGLKQARGEYVCFLDSDDWLSADALERAVEVFEKHKETDAVLFQLDIVEPDKTERYPLPTFDVLTGKEAFRLSIDWQIHGVYMVRRELHVRFPYDDSCRSFSDDNTTRIHYLHSREVRLCQGVYYYRQHPSSTSHIVNVHRFDYLLANESMKRQLLDSGVDKEIIRLWENIRLMRLVDCYMFYFMHGHELSAADRKYGLHEMRRIWQTIDRSLLDSPKVHKFGYHLMPAWWMFRCEEWLYFTLRDMLGKNG